MHILRFIDFLNSNKIITVKDVARDYNIKLRTDSGWLNNKEKEGFLARTNGIKPIKWILTEKARELANLLNLHKKDLIKLSKDTTNNNSSNP